MRLWRIASPKWALDKSCEGSKVYGGRWNPPGFGALYAGFNVEISVLEKFVHLEGIHFPPLKLVSVDVPDVSSLFFRPSLDELPKDWASLPVSSSSQDFGKVWLQSKQQLVMVVPSAILPEAQNAVINPLHSSYSKVKLSNVRDFSFDVRMLKTR